MTLGLCRVVAISISSLRLSFGRWDEMEHLGRVDAKGSCSAGAADSMGERMGTLVFFLLMSASSLGHRIGESTSIQMGGLLAIGRGLPSVYRFSAQMHSGEASMMVNADCKIQNKIKSFACGLTSNVGCALHMVKSNELYYSEKNVKIPMYISACKTLIENSSFAAHKM
jgi:hypothetical protein